MTTPLLPNTLCISLFIRADPPLPNDFHWALYHPTTPTSGTKYHITNEGHGWIAGHSRESPPGHLKSFLLVGLIRIASVNTNTGDPDDLNSKIDGILRSHDNKLNDKDGVTCRTWLLEMLGILYREGSCGTFDAEGICRCWKRQLNTGGMGLRRGPR
ncbi:hypothetical protein BDW62DRAFT_99385 [Aspergillus aurantiobrunneus]